jgi:nitrate/nitrite-specific signal transduction histidine kinase
MTRTKTLDPQTPAELGYTMPAEWEEGLLRVAQEGLTNTIKHAKAKNFRATLTIGAKEIQICLVDDGSGFDLHAEHEGFGLLGMKERVDQMGGQFILRSMPGQGTEIQIILNNSAKQKLDGPWESVRPCAFAVAGPVVPFGSRAPAAGPREPWRRPRSR